MSSPIIFISISTTTVSCRAAAIVSRSHAVMELMVTTPVDGSTETVALPVPSKRMLSEVLATVYVLTPSVMWLKIS